MSTDLVPVEKPRMIALSLEQLAEFARGVVASKMFGDDLTPSQAVVKGQIGQELGMGAGMAQIHVYLTKGGRAGFSAQFIAARVKQAKPRYNYRVKELTPSRCVITFYEDGEVCGTSDFSIEEAKKAGLTNKQVWSQYPRSLLFARALTQGVRWHCPDVLFGHTAYTVEELGEDTIDDADVIQGERPVRNLGKVPAVALPD